MEKPSRRRRPILRPLRLPHPRFTRFILSHLHPVRLRMRERRRRIRCSAPTGNIRKLKRGRSPLTPRSTCQTLTSSSKVESESMSDKGEIRFDADIDPFQGASGGPGQVAKVSNFEETTHIGSSSPPPLDLLNCPDEFKLLERDRLRPCDLKTSSPSALQQYDDYLRWFYYSHRDPAPVVSLADAAKMCLDKENSMINLWGSLNIRWHDCTLSKYIITYMNRVIDEKGEIERPFGIDAAKCIAKEAELISEWLRCGHYNFDNDEYTRCYNIRVLASRLFILRFKWSDQIGAALLGMRKEAEWLIQNWKSSSDESISTSLKIRQSAFYFVLKKLDEVEQYKIESSESEMASESDDESDDWGDDDVAVSEENYFVGNCCDEDYIKCHL